MKKIIAIGDTHGNPLWKSIVEKHKNENVIFVFVGDYFDSFLYTTLEQLYNFNEIIEFKKANKDKVVLLIGNHDYHYFPEIGDRGISGYQASKCTEITYQLNENRALLQMAYFHENILFTHAGVGLAWIERLTYWIPDLILSKFNARSIAIYVNMVWKFKPLLFNFIGSDPTGDDIGQTPIWIRPKSLMRDGVEFKKNLIQVVGHTQQNQIDIKGKSTGGRYYFIDTINSNNEYLIIENNNFSNNKI